MVNRFELLKILKREKDYEDSIVLDIISFLTYSLPKIEGLSLEEGKKIRKSLLKIHDESKVHAGIFADMIKKCERSEWKK